MGSIKSPGQVPLSHQLRSHQVESYHFLASPSHQLGYQQAHQTTFLQPSLEKSATAQSWGSAPPSPPPLHLLLAAFPSHPPRLPSPCPAPQWQACSCSIHTGCLTGKICAGAPRWARQQPAWGSAVGVEVHTGSKAGIAGEERAFSMVKKRVRALFSMGFPAAPSASLLGTEAGSLLQTGRNSGCRRAPGPRRQHSAPSSRAGRPAAFPARYVQNGPVQRCHRRPHFGLFGRSGSARMLLISWISAVSSAPRWGHPEQCRPGSARCFLSGFGGCSETPFPRQPTQCEKQSFLSMYPNVHTSPGWGHPERPGPALQDHRSPRGLQTERAPPVTPPTP